MSANPAGEVGQSPPHNEASFAVDGLIAARAARAHAGPEGELAQLDTDGYRPLRLAAVHPASS